MNKIYLILILFSQAIISYGQHSDFCGTTEKSPWLIRYQNNPSAVQSRNEETLYLPLSIHIVGTDSGGGYFPFKSLMKALCTLNNDFTDANIQFFIEGDIDYINNSSWNDHDWAAGSEMMSQSNIEETINCYIVKNPAGNCGYSSYGSGIALGIDCIKPTDHTWAHELGHFLSLPHTFYGWEGGIAPDLPKPNFREPAPDTVFVHGNAILVEKVDGSNCHDSADGFCDTPPDYLYFRWNCDEDGKSFQILDPNNESFNADGSFFMSYANDECSARFSPEQITAMRANAIDQKKYYTENEFGLDVISNPLVISSPIDSSSTFPTDILLEWEPLENAEHYIVVVSRFKSFSNLDFKGSTDGTSIVIPKLKKNKRYYWKIYPWSKFSFCNEYSSPKQFTTDLVVANEDIANTSDISVYPNLISNHQPIRIKTNFQKNTHFFIQIVDITGKYLFGQQYDNVSTNEIVIPTTDFSSGMHIISIQTEQTAFVEKIIIK